MSLRDTLPFLRSACLILFTGLGLAGCAPAEPDNVVLVVIDTLRRDHLPTYGYARQTAPFLDRLAREGAVLDGVSPSSWTKPSTASLLTGLHPLRHQAIGRVDALPAEAETLAERLKAEGYRTLGMSANGWISAAFGFEQGFDDLMLLDSVGSSEEVNRELFPALKDLEPPYFLYVHYIDPHAPYDPPTAWDGGELPAALRAQGPVSVESLDSFSDRRRPADFMTRARDLYDGEIRGADRGLEQLVGELERRGLMKNTILVVTSDHGEEFEDHGRMSHGLSLYEEVVRVPLVIHAPHRIAAGLRGGLASLLDVVPTLEDLLELPDGRELDGVSLAGRLTGNLSASPGRGGAPEESERSLLFHLDHMDGMGLALTSGRDKLLLGRRPYRKEIFDLGSDPGELRNRIEQSGPEKVQALAGGLAEMYNGYTRETLPRRPATIGDKMRGRMAALGYAAPSRKDDDPRRIPRRIVPADSRPEGLLGWEWAESLPSCSRLGDADAERHLIRGWHPAEPGGRWSKPRGLLILGVPAGERAALVLQGVNHRPDAPRVRIAVDGRPVLDAPVPPGPFRLVAKTGSLPADRPAVVEIVTDPEFVPARHGAADQRSLGLFLGSVCLGPAAAPAPGAAPTATRSGPASPWPRSSPSGSTSRRSTGTTTAIR
jgi:arylsulfatase A-like enzyme